MLALAKLGVFRKEGYIMWCVVQQLKQCKLGGLGQLARQRLVQECECGLAGLQGLERTKVRAQLVLRGRARREVICFAYNGGLGPVLGTFNHTVGRTMQPLTGSAKQTPLDLPQPMGSNRTQEAP